LVNFLRALIRFDTSNPPGNETPAAEYVAGVLAAAGIETHVAGDDPRRCSVVARLRGNGRERPLLLLSHLDVVPAQAKHWTHPPFAGVLDREGVIWGRGAVDCKALVTQHVTAMLRLKETGQGLDRDVILAATADEESPSPGGIQWLLDRHPDWLDAEFCLNEAGGEAFRLDGHTFYPIEVGEKGVCPIRLTTSGRPGHGSTPHDDQAIVYLAEAISRLAEAQFPPHHNAAVEAFFRSVGARLPLLQAQQPDMISSLQRNTVTPTGLTAGTAINVIPGTAEARFDCRVLPGQTAEDVLAEVCAIVGDLPLEIEILHFRPGLDFGCEDELYRTIESILPEHDPSGTAIPFFSPATTDSYHVAEHGMSVCGLTPVRPEPGLTYSELIHSHDERIAVSTLAFGAEIIFDIVRRFCGEK